LRLEATGTLDEPVIRFSSSPPLNSEDILLMVSAGELPRHSMDNTTADRLAKFAFILGKDLMRKLGAAEPGKERLTFRTGERISARGKVTRHIELRLTDAWSLVGEYDEYDELNAGVKWRVLRR
jgi:translocation and assembly module TamB